MTGNSIILIGPMGVGKTSVAHILAEHLDWEYIDVDELRWAFFSQQTDFDDALVDELFSAARETDAFDYMKPFESRFVVHLMKHYQSGVYDFGAGYTVYADENLFDAVKKAFAPFEHVVFLRYSENTTESLEALRRRHTDISDALYMALNKGFIESPCNQLLATMVIDTKDKTVLEVANQILDTLQSV